MLFFCCVAHFLHQNFRGFLFEIKGQCFYYVVFKQTSLIVLVVSVFKMAVQILLLTGNQRMGKKIQAKKKKKEDNFALFQQHV